jgi:hypothetical protein
MTERYVSLYPTNDSNEGNSAVARKEIRDRIAEAMKKGEIDFDMVRKHYRNQYRDNLVKSGKVPAIEASADDLAALEGSHDAEPRKKAKKEKSAKGKRNRLLPREFVLYLLIVYNAGKANKKAEEEKEEVEQDDFFVSKGDSEEEE